MQQINTTAAGCNTFIGLLKKAWPSSLLDFNPDDRITYYDNLIDFCNSSQDFDFSEEEISVICNFLYSSIKNYLEILVNPNSFFTDFDSAISHYLIFIEYISLYGRGIEVRNLFSNTLKLLLTFPVKYSDSYDCLVKLFSFYDNNSFFNKLCLHITHLMSLSINDKLMRDFTGILRHMPQETSLCLSLYPFNSRFIKTNFRFYPDECSNAELYWGIMLGYFPISFQNNTYRTLISRCEIASDSLIRTASIENPVYIFWNLSSKFSDISILNHRKFIDKLFHR